MQTSEKAALAALVDAHSDISELPFQEVLTAIARLDAREVDRLFGFQLFVRGAHGFARDFALPLFVEIGARWESGRLSITAEHMATFLAGNLLAGELRVAPLADGLPTILFTTPAGERHEFGVIVAALLASSLGVDALFLGADLPADDVARAVNQVKARAVVPGVAALDPRDTETYLGSFDAVSIETSPCGLEGTEQDASRRCRMVLRSQRTSMTLKPASARSPPKLRPRTDPTFRSRPDFGRQTDRGRNAGSRSLRAAYFADGCGVRLSRSSV